jgi:hypothetical protein
MQDYIVETKLPQYLEDCLLQVANPEQVAVIKSWLRPADEVMRVDTLKCFKASRVSFADMVCRRMFKERWQIRLLSAEVDAQGGGYFVYRIDAGKQAFSYVVRAYAWDGVEKVGRRSDGANRDLFGALFVGLADEARIAREFATFDMKADGVMRTDADVIGWTPANRSSRQFDAVVDALAAGEQPSEDLELAYLMRNGGFQASGRNGSVSFRGLPADHPLSDPFFGDIFAIFLVRVVSIDLVNALARRQNSAAAQLDPAIARQLGIGNSSGQGMCVALQRWPHWVSTWVTIRELALAFAKSTPVTCESKKVMRLSITQTVKIYDRTTTQSEEYVIPNATIVANLKTIDKLLDDLPAQVWGDIANSVTEQMDGESREQFNSLLLDIVPEFCDLISPYFRLGAMRRRVLQPKMTVAGVRDILRRNYSWALTSDRTLASSHQTFWYHSVDNGEQRRGERIIDPHEKFESFIDHIGLIQRLASVLTSYADDTRVGDVVLAHPEMHFAISRVQYLDGLPYAEIRGPIAHRDFRPADLIRFFLASLGIRGSTPLSIRYVRGTFFQNEPLPRDFLNDKPVVAKLKVKEVQA